MPANNPQPRLSHHSGQPTTEESLTPHPSYKIGGVWVNAHLYFGFTAIHPYRPHCFAPFFFWFAFPPLAIKQAPPRPQHHTILSRLQLKWPCNLEQGNWSVWFVNRATVSTCVNSFQACWYGRLRTSPQVRPCSRRLLSRWNIPTSHHLSQLFIKTRP